MSENRRFLSKRKARRTDLESVRKMANQSYYWLSGGASQSNRADESVALTVNCCGEAVIREEWGHRAPLVRKDYYFLHSMGGNIVGQIDGREVCIMSGQAICISAGTPYQLRTETPMSKWTHYYWIHFTGFEAAELLAHSGIEPNSVFDVGVGEEIFSYYERLFSEFRTQSPEFEYNAALQLRYVLYSLGRARGDRKRGRLDRSIRYIHTHLRYELTVEELAAMEFLGVSRYRELFRQETGTSPSEYIASLRTERAKYLLSQTDMTIAEIAEAVGYENRHYFQAVFKARVGITPGAFRRLG